MSSQRYVSDTLKRKKNRIKKIKIYITISLILIFLILLVLATRISSLQITEIKISGNTFVTNQEIEGKAQAILKKNILGIIPERNIFLFPKKELKDSLKENPAVIDVKIRKKYFNTISIEINEQEKEMIYCTSIEKTDCYYINKSGFIYAKVNEFIIPEQERILYIEKAQKNIKDNVTDEKTYSSLVLFIKNVGRYDIKVGEIYLKPDGVIEFVTREQVRLITSIFDDFGKDFTNLIALFDKGVIAKDQISQIDYIDLRFGNKVFYKNKTN